MGREAFSSLLRKCVRASLFIPANRRIQESIFRRVLAWSGKASGPGELDGLLRACADIHSAHLLSIYTLSREEAEARSKSVDLEVLQPLRRLLAGGRGAILAGPHFGDQALAMSALCAAGIPLHAQFVNAEPYQWTSEIGLRTISLGSGAAQCAAALKANEVVLLYSDLDFFPAGRTSLFFGAPVRPPHGPARLALHCSAPILPFYPVSREGRLRVLCDAPLAPGERNQEELESALLQSMEAFIGRYPEHWWVGKDIWDIEGTDAANRRQLRMAGLVRSLRG